MSDKAMNFAEGQLKKVSMAESFTPELKAQMKTGVPVIAHPFQQQYDDGSASVIQHWQKSPTFDYYFLNKFDSEVKLNNQESVTKQTNSSLSSDT